MGVIAMRKVINGKTYDTETATRIGSIKVQICFYTLYYKRTGEYFVVSTPVETTNEEKYIIPISYLEARQLEAHIKTEKIDADVSSKKLRMNAYLDSENVTRLRDMARAYNVSMNKMLNTIIKNTSFYTEEDFEEMEMKFNG